MAKLKTFFWCSITTAWFAKVFGSIGSEEVLVLCASSAGPLKDNCNSTSDTVIGQDSPETVQDEKILPITETKSDDVTSGGLSPGNEMKAKEVQAFHWKFWEPSAPKPAARVGANSGHQATGPASDACSFRSAVLGGATPTSGDSYYTTLDSLRSCMMSTRISRYNMIWTLHNLLYGLAETYSFTDIATGSLNSIESNVCHFKVHEVKVDLEAELRAEIGKFEALFLGKPKSEIDTLLAEELPAYEFHKKLVVVLNKLHDAHTTYSTPYTMFRVYSPVTFGSKMVEVSSGSTTTDTEGSTVTYEQKVTMRLSESPYDVLGRLSVAYQKVYGVSSFPIPSSKNEQIIDKINGMPALDFLKILASDEGLLAASYQQLEQRMNAFIFNAPLLAFSQVLSYLPDFDELAIHFESDPDQLVYHVKLLGQFSDLSRSPYAHVPNLRSVTALSAYLHSNTAFNAFMGQERDLEVKKPTLWEIPNGQIDSIFGAPKMALLSPAKLLQLSRKHRALLDPVHNLVRDNILNVPTDWDTMGGLGSPSPDSKSFFPAEALEQIIDQTLAISGTPVVDMNSFSTSGSLFYQILGDTVVVKISSFAPKSQGPDDSSFYFFPEFSEIQQIAKQSGVTRLLIDVSGNGGGFIISAYAMMWYVMMDNADICTPMRKRMTKNWDLWIDTFGGGISSIVKKYLSPLGKDYVVGHVDEIFDEIVSIVTLVYEGLNQSPEDLGSVSKNDAIFLVNKKREYVLKIPSMSAKNFAILDYLSSGDYLPNDISIKHGIFHSNNVGFPPFDAEEFFDSNGKKFSPPLSNYKNSEHRLWGDRKRTTRVSQAGEYNFCMSILNDMPTIVPDYDRNYWTQISFVSDGTCGSACALFLQGVQLTGEAVGFTYGGIAGGEPIDVASFAGGNLEEYDNFTAQLALARRVAKLSSQGQDPWSKSHDNSFVDSPVPMSTKGSARFNWNMMFAKAMLVGIDQHGSEDGNNQPLPRQFYIIPPTKHVTLWPRSPTDMQLVYADIISLPDWGALIPQFKHTHGQCPDQDTPFKNRRNEVSSTIVST